MVFSPSQSVLPELLAADITVPISSNAQCVDLMLLPAFIKETSWDDDGKGVKTKNLQVADRLQNGIHATNHYYYCYGLESLGGIKGGLRLSTFSAKWCGCEDCLELRGRPVLQEMRFDSPRVNQPDQRLYDLLASVIADEIMFDTARMVHWYDLATKSFYTDPMTHTPSLKALEAKMNEIFQGLGLTDTKMRDRAYLNRFVEKKLDETIQKLASKDLGSILDELF